MLASRSWSGKVQCECAKNACIKRAQQPVENDRNAKDTENESNENSKKKAEKKRVTNRFELKMDIRTHSY